MQGNLQDLIVAQMMGHSSAGILHTYAKLIDGYRRDAIRKLGNFRESYRESVLPQEMPRGMV